MPDVRRFPYLPVKVPRSRILKRLGYISRSSRIPAETMAEVDSLIEKTADLIELKAVSLRVETSIAEIFNSSKLNNFLAESDQLLLMGITGGSTVTDAIEMYKTEGKLTEAVVTDAAASEIVDEGLNRLAEIFSRELVREARALTSRRFSAGYGDFDIRFQKDIYRMLGLEAIGVRINESCLLMPEKSVTAIYGILPSAEC